MHARDRNLSMRAPALMQRGVTLLEVLVTLFIITLFLLTSAGVQSSAVKLNKAAQFRTEAVLLATEIGERMEANRVGAASGDYNCPSCSTTTAPSTSCVNSTCTSSALATFDLQEWGKRVGDTLPGATVSIAWTCVSASCDPNTNPPSRVFGTYVVTLGWTDRRTNVTYDTVGSTEAFQYIMTKQFFYDPG